MYYITNQTDQIIAMDNALLDLFNIDTIEVFTKKIILEEIVFSSLEDKIAISYQDKTHHFILKEYSLSSILGEFHLRHLSIEEAEEHTPLEEETNEAISMKDDLDISDFDIDTLILKDEPLPEIEKVNISYDTTDNMLDSENELNALVIPNSPETTIDTISIETKEETKTEEMPLIPDEPEEKDIGIKEDTLPDTPEDEKTIEEPIAPIVINIETISQSIGISQEDYSVFLDEYMDTAITLEDDLKSDDPEIRTTAIETLIQLAEVLHLPKVNEIISSIDTLTSNKRIDGVSTFYNTLSSITVETQDTKTQSSEIHYAEEENDKNKIELFDLAIDSNDEKEAVKGFGSIDLSEVKPMPFPFKISQAAEELSLPEELIEEFVHDFIEQAHEETQKMLAAYEKGDLDTIQKIGHLLKGTSSNLRIHALADTLYAIQFCEDSTQLEDLIKQYWGHFLSFEQQVDALAHKGKN